MRPNRPITTPASRSGRKPGGRKAEPLSLYNRGISRFQIAREAGGIEQRMGCTVARELRLERRHALRVTREIQSEGFVILQRLRNQFGHAQGVQQARPHPSRERSTAAGEDGKPGPERIACRGMGVVGNRVEEKIGEL